MALFLGPDWTRLATGVPSAISMGRVACVFLREGGAMRTTQHRTAFVLPEAHLPFRCCPSLPRAELRAVSVSDSSLGHSVAVKQRSSHQRGSLLPAGARRPRRDSNGGVAQVPEEVTIPSDDDEPEGMYMGRKLDGLEPSIWEGEKWDTFGFIMQYLWAFGILIALVACGVAVTSYNSGARDIRDTSVFKEGLEGQEGTDSSFEYESGQDFPEASEAPSVD